MYPGFNGSGYPGYPPPPSSCPPSYPTPPQSSYPYGYPQAGAASAPTPYSPPGHYAPSQQGSAVSSSTNTGYYWIDWNAHRMVPPAAVRGGVDRDGATIYVGRAYHEGDWIPAKVIPDRQIAYVAYAGAEHAKSSFQLLCEQRFTWVQSSGGSIPPGAVEGGRTNTGERLYIGRLWHNGAHTVGKVHPSHNCCYIPYGGLELSFPNYEILVLQM